MDGVGTLDLLCSHIRSQTGTAGLAHGHPAGPPAENLLIGTSCIPADTRVAPPLRARALSALIMCRVQGATGGLLFPYVHFPAADVPVLLNVSNPPIRQLVVT